MSLEAIAVVDNHIRNCDQIAFNLQWAPWSEQRLGKNEREQSDSPLRVTMASVFNVRL